MNEEEFVCLWIIKHHGDSPGSTEDRISEARKVYAQIREQLK